MQKSKTCRKKNGMRWEGWPLKAPYTRRRVTTNVHRVMNRATLTSSEMEESDSFKGSYDTVVM